MWSVSVWAAFLFVVALYLFVKTQHYIFITTTGNKKTIAVSALKYE